MKNILLILFLIPVIAGAQMKREVFRYGAEGYYLKYTPTHYKAQGVILFMHGTGEEGNTLEDLLGANGPERNEIPKLFKAGKEKPYIFIVPMLKKGSSSWPPDVLYRMLDILDVYQAQGYNIHETGLSLGGIGVHAMAKIAYERHGAGYFKTIGAVCGRVNSPVPAWYENTYLKMWHGEKDITVYPQPDRSLFKLLDPLYPGKIQYLEYPGAGHSIWGTAYNEDAGSYWRWLNTVAPVSLDPIDSQSDTVRLKIIIDRPYIIEP